MKLTLKDIIYGAIIIMIIVFFFKEGCNHDQYVEDIQTTHRKDSVQTYKDAEGRWVAQVKAKEVSLKALKNSNAKEVQELKKEVKNWKDLNNTVKFSTSTSGSVATGLRDSIIYLPGKHDTLPPETLYVGQSFHWADEWLTIDGVVTDGDSIFIDYEVDNTYRVNTIWKRPKWYKRKELVIEVVSFNPSTKAEEITTFMVKQSPGILNSKIFIVIGTAVLTLVGSRLLIK